MELSDSQYVLSGGAFIAILTVGFTQLRKMARIVERSYEKSAERDGRLIERLEKSVFTLENKVIELMQIQDNCHQERIADGIKIRNLESEVRKLKKRLIPIEKDSKSE